MKVTYAYSAIVMDVSDEPKQLRVALAERDLTARQLAQECGLSISAVYKIARGYLRPSPAVAARIHSFLGVEIFTTPESASEQPKTQHQTSQSNV